MPRDSPHFLQQGYVQRRCGGPACRNSCALAAAPAPSRYSDEFARGRNDFLALPLGQGQSTRWQPGLGLDQPLLMIKRPAKAHCPLPRSERGERIASLDGVPPRVAFRWGPPQHFWVCGHVRDEWASRTPWRGGTACRQREADRRGGASAVGRAQFWFVTRC